MGLPAYRVAQTISGNAPYTREFTTAGVIVEGTGVLVGDAGTITALVDDAAPCSGIALHAAASGAQCLVALGVVDTIFSAAIASGTYTDELIGEYVDYNVAGVALDSSADDVFSVEGPDATDTSRVLLTFHPLTGAGYPGAGLTTTD